MHGARRIGETTMSIRNVLGVAALAGCLMVPGPGFAQSPDPIVPETPLAEGINIELTILMWCSSVFWEERSWQDEEDGYAFYDELSAELLAFAEAFAAQLEYPDEQMQPLLDFYDQTALEMAEADLMDDGSVDTEGSAFLPQVHACEGLVETLDALAEELDGLAD